MEVRLKVLVGANAGRELLIPGPKFFIGRAEDCQLRPRSDLISRHHCALVVEDGYVAVRDFGSKNGTIVNNEKVVGEREIKTGDRLVLGPLEFEVSVVETQPAKKRPKVESVKEAAVRTAESSSTEMDVSQWLAPADKQVSNADTRVIDANETREIDLEGETIETESGGTERTVTEPAAASPPAPKAAALATAKPGKLPTPPQKASADSRGAASDVLNKFFKRR
jgi:pSer/pThr/pTyr-binding forkhead associated (FHA) protein